MQRRYDKFGEAEQACCVQGYMGMQYEVFLDFDPVPYPGVEDGHGHEGGVLTPPHWVVRVAEDG